MNLLAPAALLALFGLAVPLLVHLQRQIQREPVSFAALRWLSAAARPRQRLRLQQWPLLLLRMLLVALLALLLAQPVDPDPDYASRWVLVHPALSPPQTDLADAEVAMRWLAPGFPAIESTTAEVDVATASLLREIDARLPTTTTLEVHLPAVVDGLDGERLALRRDLEIVVGSTAESPAGTVPPQSPRWALRFEDSAHPSLVFLRAGFAALTEPPIAGPQDAPQTFAIDSAAELSAPASDSEALWWLSDRSPADDPAVQGWIERGGVAIWLPAAAIVRPSPAVPVWRSEDGERALLGQRRAAGWLLQPSALLVADQFDEVLQPDFPKLLRQWAQLRPAPVDHARAQSLRPARNQAAAIDSTEPLERPLLWLLLVVLVIERIAAGWQRRRAG